VLTLLLDPRGSVHATSGVLPVEQIAIPPEHYTDAVASLSLALSSHPVLSAGNTAAMSLALPKLSSGGWSWITIADRQWRTADTAAAASEAALNYTPQQISEGWLVIRPEEHRPQEHRPQQHRPQEARPAEHRPEQRRPEERRP